MNHQMLQQQQALQQQQQMLQAQQAQLQAQQQAHHMQQQQHQHMQHMQQQPIIPPHLQPPHIQQAHLQAQQQHLQHLQQQHLQAQHLQHMQQQQQLQAQQQQHQIPIQQIPLQQQQIPIQPPLPIQQPQPPPIQPPPIQPQPIQPQQHVVRRPVNPQQPQQSNSSSSVSSTPTSSSYHGQQQQMRGGGLKKYEIQKPADKKDLGPDLGVPDFYPLDEKSKEDTLSQEFILGGFCERYQHDECKSSSSIFKNFDFPKVKEQLLQSIYQVEWKKNSSQKSGQITASTNKSGNKRPVPEQKAWSANHRESWVLKLAGNEPLQKLASTVPHGYKGETLLKMFLDNQVPLIRATWYTKIVYGNMPKHKTVEPSNDWTKTIVQSLFALIRNTTSENNNSGGGVSGSAGIGGVKKTTSSYTGILYIERLIKWNFTEGLLNKDILLSMLIDHLNETDRSEEAVLISSLLLYYSDTLILSTYHSNKFLTKAYEKLMKITISSSSTSNSTTTSTSTTTTPVNPKIQQLHGKSSHHQQQQQLQQQQVNITTPTTIPSINSIANILSPSNQKIYSILCIISKQISMNLPDTFMTFKNFKELVSLIWPSNLIERIEYNQLSFINNLRFTISPEYKWINKYYSEINRKQQLKQQLITPSPTTTTNNTTTTTTDNNNNNNGNNKFRGLNYSELIKSLDKFYIVLDLKILYQEIFGNQISLEDDKEKILLICEWACTQCRNNSFTILSATSLLKIFERNLSIKLNNLFLNHPLQNILVQFLETFKPKNIELNRICQFYSELIRNEIFSQNSYARYLISRGVLESGGNGNSSSKFDNNQFHKYYLKEFPIFNKNDFPSYEIHQQRNQRRTILFPNTMKSQEEINSMEKVRDSIKLFITATTTTTGDNGEQQISLVPLLQSIQSLSYYSQISLTEWLSLCIRLNFNNSVNLQSSDLMKGFRHFSFPITQVYIEKIFLLMESISNYHAILQCLLVFWDNLNGIKELQSFVFYTTKRLQQAFIVSDQFIPLLDIIYKKVLNNSGGNGSGIKKKRNHNHSHHNHQQQNGISIDHIMNENSDDEDNDDHNNNNEENDGSGSDDEDEDDDDDEDDSSEEDDSMDDGSKDSSGGGVKQPSSENNIESYLYDILNKFKSIKSVQLWIKRNSISCKLKKELNNDENMNDKIELSNICKDTVERVLFIKNSDVGSGVVNGIKDDHDDYATKLTDDNLIKRLDQELVSNSIINSLLVQFKSKQSTMNIVSTDQDICQEMIKSIISTSSNCNIVNNNNNNNNNSNNNNQIIIFIKQQMVLSRLLCHFSTIHPISMNGKELFLKLFKNHLQLVLDNGDGDNEFIKINLLLISLILNQYIDVYSIMIYLILPLLQQDSILSSDYKVWFLIKIVQVLICDGKLLELVYQGRNGNEHDNLSQIINYQIISLKLMNKSKIASLSSIFQTLCKLYHHYEPLSNSGELPNLTFKGICTILTDPDSRYTLLIGDSIDKIKQLGLGPVQTRYLFYLILGNLNSRSNNGNGKEEEEEERSEFNFKIQDSKIIIQYEQLKLENCITYSFKVINSTLTNSSNCYWNIHLSYTGLKLLLDEWKTLPLIQSISTPTIKSPTQSPVLQSQDLTNSTSTTPTTTSTSTTTTTTTTSESISPESIITQFILLHFEENKGWERVFIYENLFLLFPQEVRNELVKITTSILETQYRESNFIQPTINLPLINHIKENLPIILYLKQQPHLYSIILNRPVNNNNNNNNSINNSNDQQQLYDNILFQESFTDIIINILNTYDESSIFVNNFILSLFKQLHLFIQYSKGLDAINIDSSTSDIVIQSLVIRITFLITRIRNIKLISKQSFSKLEEISTTLLLLLSKFLIQSEDEFNLFDPILTIFDQLLSDKYDNNNGGSQSNPQLSLQQQIDQKNSIKKKLHELYQKIKHSFPSTLSIKLEKQLSFLTSNQNSAPFTIIHPPCLINNTATATSTSLTNTTSPQTIIPTTPPIQPQQQQSSSATAAGSTTTANNQLIPVSSILEIKATFTQMDPWTLLEDYSETPLSPSIFGGVKMERKELTYIKSSFPSRSMTLINEPVDQQLLAQRKQQVQELNDHQNKLNSNNSHQPPPPPPPQILLQQQNQQQPQQQPIQQLQQPMQQQQTIPPQPPQILQQQQLQAQQLQAQQLQLQSQHPIPIPQVLQQHQQQQQQLAQLQQLQAQQQLQLQAQQQQQQLVQQQAALQQAQLQQLQQLQAQQAALQQQSNLKRNYNNISTQQPTQPQNVAPPPISQQPPQPQSTQSNSKSKKTRA